MAVAAVLFFVCRTSLVAVLVLHGIELLVGAIFLVVLCRIVFFSMLMILLFVMPFFVAVIVKVPLVENIMLVRLMREVAVPMMERPGRIDRTKKRCSGTCRKQIVHVLPLALLNLLSSTRYKIRRHYIFYTPVITVFSQYRQLNF